MKLVAAALITFLFLSIQLTAQTDKGNFEFSVSGTFGSSTMKTEFKSGTTSKTYDDEGNDYAIMAVRAGYFLINGLEIEPEFLLTAAEEVRPAFSLSGNVSYNYKIPESHIAPFVLAGYGITNSIGYADVLIARASDEMDIGQLNLGAGFKFFFSDHAAARIEYRYQRFNQSVEQTYIPGNTTTTETTLNLHRILLGFSFFL